MPVELDAQTHPSLLAVPDEEPIALIILLLANLLRKSANLTYNAILGLSSIEWSMLARLGDDGPMTQSEFADKYLHDKGQLSRAAVALAEQGLISREKRDWRTIELRLTPKGRKTFSVIRRISRERHRVLIAGVSTRELKVLYNALAKIDTNASALLNQLRSMRGAGTTSQTTVE